MKSNGTMSVERKEAGALTGTRGWVLLSGRRKIGKTYLLRHCVRSDLHLEIRRDGVAIDVSDPGRRFENPEDVAVEVVKLLREGQTVVIDEFQRMPDGPLETIASAHPAGKLYLSGSSFRLTMRTYARDSPLLGFFTYFRLDLIDPADIIISLSKKMDAVTAIEYGAFARDPWIIERLGWKDVLDDLHATVMGARGLVSGMVGEVFSEEERTITRTYDAIIRLVSAGVWKPVEMAARLHAMGVTSSPASTTVGPYLKALLDMNLVERIPVYGSRKVALWKMRSPVMELYYYLDDRYGSESADVPMSVARPAISNRRDLAVQSFLAEMFAAALGSVRECSLEPELDAVLTRRHVPTAVIEVKWGRYGMKDLLSFRDKTAALPGRKLFLTKAKGATLDGVDVLGAEDILAVARDKKL